MDHDQSEPELGQLDLLSPDRIRLFKHRGMLCLETETAVHLKIRATRAFPLSLPNSYIGFLSRDGKDVGVIEDFVQLDKETRALLEEALQKRYFAPKILRIHAIQREHGNLNWRVETDLGSREFSVHDFRENLLSVSGNSLYVTDVDGNRYDIGRLSDLDASSKAILDRWV